MGETQDAFPVETGCCVRQRDRRNAMWNIYEGVEETVLQRLSGLTLDTMQQLVVDSTDDTISQCLAHLTPNTSESSPPCDRVRIHRSHSTPAAGEGMRATLQNRRRRNAVGNLFDLLTPSQKLLLVEHLQEQMERLQGFCSEVSEDSIILSLADLSSSLSPQSSGNSSGSSNSSSQGEIVCR
ncbi:hypothetical protein ACOMHN_063394 [Nucella lapillus]